MSSKKFCSKCGKELTLEAKFCKYCGQPSVVPTTPTVSATSVVPIAAMSEPSVVPTVSIDSKSLTGFAKIKKCFFSNEGRLNRKRFLIRTICLTLLGIIIFMGNLIMFDGLDQGMFELSTITVITILNIMIFYSNLTLTTRRYHDLDKSGWYFFTAIIPLVNLYYIYLLIFAQGTDGENKFGPDPLKIAKADDDLF